MLVAIAIIIGGLLLVAVMIRPFWGVLWLWPVLLLYPHALTKDLLPFNIGFDDIFVAFVFLATFLRRAATGEFRFGKWGWFILTYWLLLVFSSFYGLAYTNIEFAVGFITKEAVKNSTVAMVAFIVVYGVDESDQIPRLVRWFFIAIIGLSVLAILQYFFPEMAAPFYQAEYMGAGEEVWRATGTTRGPWEIGGVLGVSIILCTALLVLGRGIISRPLPIVCAIVSLVAIILSRSRAGWLFMVTGVLTILILSKKPVTTLVVVAIIASITLLFPILSEIFVERVEQTGTLGSLSDSVTARFMIWKKMLTNISIGSIIVGIGRIGAYARYGHSAHNYYIAVLVETGIIGIFYFILLALSLWRRTWTNIRFTQNPTILALWKGIFAVNVGVLFYSIPVETLDVDLVAKALFFFWSLLYLRDYFTTENYPSESYDDISYEQQEDSELFPVYEY